MGRKHRVAVNPNELVVLERENEELKDRIKALKQELNGLKGKLIRLERALKLHHVPMPEGPSEEEEAA